MTIFKTLPLKSKDTSINYTTDLILKTMDKAPWLYKMLNKGNDSFSSKLGITVKKPSLLDPNFKKSDYDLYKALTEKSFDAYTSDDLFSSFNVLKHYIYDTDNGKSYDAIWNGIPINIYGNYIQIGTDFIPKNADYKFFDSLDSYTKKNMATIFVTINNNIYTA